MDILVSNFGCLEDDTFGNCVWQACLVLCAIVVLSDAGIRSWAGGTSGSRTATPSRSQGSGATRPSTSPSLARYLTCRLSPVTCHLSPLKCHLSPVTCHLSHLTCHLSPVTCHLSPVTCHLTPVTCHLSPDTCHLSHVICHLSNGCAENCWSNFALCILYSIHSLPHLTKCVPKLYKNGPITSLKFQQSPKCNESFRPGGNIVHKERNYISLIKQVMIKSSCWKWERSMKTLFSGNYAINHRSALRYYIWIIHLPLHRKNMLSKHINTSLTTFLLIYFTTEIQPRYNIIAMKTGRRRKKKRKKTRRGRPRW